jgi:glycosyltransferase involved in cell wall biosynthesis
MLRPENMPSVKKRIWATLWEKKNVSGASVICFTSEDELEAANACRWELPPIALIPNPIDVHSGADDVRMDAKTGRIVLFVGRLAKVKRIDLLLRAIAVLKGEYPNVLLRLAGPDWEGKRAKYVAMAKELGIYGNVEFMGMQNGDQLRVSYRGADIVTLVSQRENFGMAAAEGMGAGLPAVLTKNVGLASDAQEAGAAIITEDSPESIAGAFYKLLTDNTLRHQMGVNARRLVLDKYSPPTVAKQMIEVYKWCLGQAEKPDCVILD